MKKTSCILLICLSLCLTFVSCAKTFYYELKDEVEKIEIINIQEFYPDRNYVLLKTLSEEEMDELLLELSKIEFTYSMGPPNTSPEGLCLKLNCKNGEFMYINYNTSIKFNNENSIRTGERNLRCPEEKFYDDQYRNI